MIQVENLTFSYQNGAPVFQNFSWQVGRGESWAVLGPSGCGKTTLLYLIAGLLTPDTGQILIDGERVDRPRPQSGLILQDYGLLPWATVTENARLGLRIRAFYGPDGTHAPRDQALDLDISYWLERLGLTEHADKFPSQLSGGQRQRTAIARTLALHPDLLLMDEPFSSLDAPTREGLQQLTLELRAEQGLTLVIVTHAIEEAAFIGQKILLLSDPPNCTTNILHNPSSGNAEFRESEAYLNLCRELRSRMG